MIKIENLIKISQGEKTSLSEGELIILKDIYACVKDALTFDEFIKSLEEKELSFKNIIREQLQSNYKYLKLIDKKIIQTIRHEYNYIDTLSLALMKTPVEIIC